MAVITALVGAVVGFLGAYWLHRGVEKRTRRQQLKAVAAEALAAAINLQLALIACRQQSTAWSTRWPLAAAAATELLGVQPAAWRSGMASALRSLSQRNLDQARTAQTLLIAPLARVTTALVHLSMADYPGVRTASHELRGAIERVMANFESERGWAREGRNFETAIARLRAESDRAATDRGRRTPQRSLRYPTFIQHAGRRWRRRAASNDKHVYQGSAGQSR